MYIIYAYVKYCVYMGNSLFPRWVVYKIKKRIEFCKIWFKNKLIKFNLYQNVLHMIKINNFHHYIVKMVVVRLNKFGEISNGRNMILKRKKIGHKVQRRKYTTFKTPPTHELFCRIGSPKHDGFCWSTQCWSFVSNFSKFYSTFVPLFKIM